MTKQYHFIVIVNEDGTFQMDYDTSINFDNGDVWNEEEHQWYFHTDNEVFEGYEEAADRLEARLSGSPLDKLRNR